jgi:cell division septation protein DedD
VVEREASGDFDYLWDDPADAEGLTSDDDALEVQPAEELGSPPKDPGDDLWDEPDDNFWDNQLDSGHFDAFNYNTWSFRPAPMPWYRTKQALTAIIAASAAVAAIVVSGVLLVFRGPANTVDKVTSSVTPTAPTSAPVAVATSAEPPPPPPPPETASAVNTAPRYNPTYQPRPTKAPEIGVTRTPVTRLPISVAPQPRTGQHALR